MYLNQGLVSIIFDPFSDMLNNPCSGGVNCEVGTIDETDQEECARGFICIEDVGDPIACPPGTYNPEKGKGKRDFFCPTVILYMASSRAW